MPALRGGRSARRAHAVAPPRRRRLVGLERAFRTTRAGTCRCRIGTASDAYLAATLDDTLAALARSRDGERYFFELALYHEDMHGEALLMTLQSLGLAGAAGMRCRGARAACATRRRHRSCPAARLRWARARGDDAQRFVFDNEKWAHEVDARAVRHRARAA